MDEVSAWLRDQGVRVRRGRLERLARRGRIRAAYFGGEWVFDPEAVRGAYEGIR